MQLLNSINTSSRQKAESEDMGEKSIIFLVELTESVRKLPSGKC